MGPLLSCLCLPILRPVNGVSKDGRSLISADLPQERQNPQLLRTLSPKKLMQMADWTVGILEAWVE